MNKLAIIHVPNGDLIAVDVSRADIAPGVDLSHDGGEGTATCSAARSSTSSISGRSSDVSPRRLAQRGIERARPRALPFIEHTFSANVEGSDVMRRSARIS
jgi:hypothetical protein